MSRQANDRFALKRNSRLTWFFNCSNSRNLINLNEALRSPAVTSLHLHVIESVSVYPSTLRFVFFRPSSIVVLSPFLSPSSFISLFLHFAYSWLLCWVHWGRGEGGGSSDITLAGLFTASTLKLVFRQFQEAFCAIAAIFTGKLCRTLHSLVNQPDVMRITRQIYGYANVYYRIFPSALSFVID